MIIISADYYGPELKGSIIWDAISSAMRVMRDLRNQTNAGTLGEVPHVNAVFRVSGSLGEPDFDAVRVGAYSSKDKCVQVDVAVRGWIENAENARVTVVSGLHMANAAAFHFFQDRSEEFPLRDAESLVALMSKELTL
jgi:hypothetical protein